MKGCGAWSFLSNQPRYYSIAFHVTNYRPPQYVIETSPKLFECFFSGRNRFEYGKKHRVVLEFRPDSKFKRSENPRQPIHGYQIYLRKGNPSTPTIDFRNNTSLDLSNSSLDSWPMSTGVILRRTEVIPSDYNIESISITFGKLPSPRGFVHYSLYAWMSALLEIRVSDLIILKARDPSIDGPGSRKTRKIHSPLFAEKELMEIWDNWLVAGVQRCINSVSQSEKEEEEEG